MKAFILAAAALLAGGVSAKALPAAKSAGQRAKARGWAPGCFSMRRSTAV